jgi:hypothetical protein
MFDMISRATVYRISMAIVDIRVKG